jgi:hypothetical protein
MFSIIEKSSICWYFVSSVAFAACLKDRPAGGAPQGRARGRRGTGRRARFSPPFDAYGVVYIGFGTLNALTEKPPARSLF